MAEEYRRTRGRKKILLPSGDEVYIPTLVGISLIDPRDRYQEYQYTIDNSAEADRDIHVDDVYPVVVDADGNPVDDPPVQDTSSNPLKVERIDTWRVLDPRSRYQESHVEFDNRTGAELLPPRFTQHYQTHVYRYYQDPENPSDDGPWIDTELMDGIAHVDPRSRYQETIHSFNNPFNGEFRGGDLSGQASASDPDVTIGTGEGTADNPVRLDPFQNIINYNCKPPGVFFVYEGSFRRPGQGMFPTNVWLHTSSDGYSWSTYETDWTSLGPYAIGRISYGNGMMVVSGTTSSDEGAQESILATTDFSSWTLIWKGKFMPSGGSPPAADWVYLVEYRPATNDWLVQHGYVGDHMTDTVLVNPITRNAARFDGPARPPDHSPERIIAGGIHYTYDYYDQFHPGPPDHTAFPTEAFYVLLRDGDGIYTWVPTLAAMHQLGETEYYPDDMEAWLRVPGGASTLTLVDES